MFFSHGCRKWTLHLLLLLAVAKSFFPAFHPDILALATDFIHRCLIAESQLHQQSPTTTFPRASMLIKPFSSSSQNLICYSFNRLPVEIEQERTLALSLLRTPPQTSTHPTTSSPHTSITEECSFLSRYRVRRVFSALLPLSASTRC